MYENLKNFVKKFPKAWNTLRFVKDFLINLSRLKDVLVMFILLNIWPEQVYRFSTRKLLPCKKNRYEKNSKPNIPYELLKNKTSNIPRMKEINIIARGSSFDLNHLKEIEQPTFLVAFSSPLKISKENNVFYEHYFSHQTGKFVNNKKSWNPKFLENLNTNDKDLNSYDFKKSNITYLTARSHTMESFKKRGHNTLSIEVHTIGKKNEYFSRTNDASYFNLINSGCNRISIAEKIYKPPVTPPYPGWTPAGSLIIAISALSHFAEKINVYGWDNHLNFVPNEVGYLQLMSKIYKYKFDVVRWKAQFEHSIINFYYADHFSKMPNISINGYMAHINKHDKFVKKIERVLFN